MTDADAIQKYKGLECKAQLQAWGTWLTEQGFKIGSKNGQVDCLVTGRVPVLKAKLISLADVYGSKMAADRQPDTIRNVVANTEALLVERPIPAILIASNDERHYESDDEEDRMGRITASQKWGEFDDDCNVASSGSFNGK